MAFFRHSWQFLQLAQFVQQLGELVRLLGLLGLLVAFLVADNRAHVRPSLPEGRQARLQKGDLQQHQAIDQWLVIW